jgi:hypothetical protein
MIQSMLAVEGRKSFETAASNVPVVANSFRCPMVRMTPSLAGVLFLVIALRVLAAAPQIHEAQVRESIKARGRSLLLAGDLQGFETLADQYRMTQERTPAGAWKLWVLYKSINTLGPGGPTDPQWMRLEPQLRDWLAHNSSSATATIVTAKTYYEHAWSYRGNGYAREVGSGNWGTYKTLVERARAVLDAHSGVASVDPEWDTLRIAIAREQGANSSTILDDAARRQACDDWAFRGIVRRGSLPHRVHAYVNFLMGKGYPYWRNTGLLAALALAFVQTGMWLASGRPRTNRDRWLPSASRESLFNPTAYPRSYRILPQVQLVGNALALLITAVSLASVRAILPIPWGDPAETQTVVVLLLVTAALGVIFVLRGTPTGSRPDAQYSIGLRVGRGVPPLVRDASGRADGGPLRARVPSVGQVPQKVLNTCCDGSGGRQYSADSGWST